jgi:hypothetical protein
MMTLSRQSMQNMHVPLTWWLKMSSSRATLTIRIGPRIEMIAIV